MARATKQKCHKEGFKYLIRGHRVKGKCSNRRLKSQRPHRLRAIPYGTKRAPKRRIGGFGVHHPRR